MDSKVDNSTSSVDHGKKALSRKDYMPLWQAMRGGHVDIVEILIGLGADPDEKCASKKFKNHTFLQYASKLEASAYSPKVRKVVEVLVRHGAEMNTSQSSKMRSPLFNALINQNVELAELLLKNGAKLEGPDWKNTSPAQEAFDMIDDDVACEKMISLFSRYGLIDPKYHDSEGNNLLHMLIDATMFYEDNGGSAVAKIAEIFLDLGVPVDEPDSYGCTPLHRAVSPLRQFYVQFDFELASLYVKRGANVNLKSPDEGIYPLALAAREGDEALVDLLISNGADLHAKCDEFGLTALHVACIGGFKFNTKVIDLLIEKGADVKIKDKLGRTPLNLLNRFNVLYKMQMQG